MSVWMLCYDLGMLWRIGHGMRIGSILCLFPAAKLLLPIVVQCFLCLLSILGLSFSVFFLLCFARPTGVFVSDRRGMARFQKFHKKGSPLLLLCCFFPWLNPLFISCHDARTEPRRPLRGRRPSRAR
jgi:hypothetical protein